MSFSNVRNVEAFERELDDFLIHDLVEMKRERMTVISLVAMRGFMERTPVDTGRAKGNWQIAIGEPPEGYDDDRRDPTPTGVVGSSAPLMETIEGALSGWDGQMVWFHNGVPYIEYINDGTDKVPAEHILERTIEHIERWLETA